MRHQVNSGNLISRVVRHLENASLLSECQAALEHAVQLFRLQSQVATVATLGQIQAFAKNQYELTSLAVARESFTTLGTMQSRTSNISLLPGSPKIFYGRDGDLQHIISNLVRDDSSRIAILGPGGVGKSSLALAVLYEPRVVAKFGSERRFVSCESSQSANDIAAAILSHFVLERDRNPIKAVLQHLSGLECPALIVLDNMETPWEIPGERTVVEDFLSHLSSINQLHLIITMRGEERPGNVRWTRPFLRPLSPLSDAAARQVFFDITDVAEDDTLLDELLSFTDNLPLAVTLMASLVSFEGAASVVERWQSDRISLFSDGADKNSNLSTSIAMSLSSPRLTAIPDAMTLLRLLSVLPDGVTDLALVQMGLPIVDISLCRVTLCRTSLAYVDHDHRLKALVPIREHIRASYPPPPPLTSSMRNFFYQPVGVFYRTWAKAVGTDLVHRISADLGNISSLLHIALGTENPPSHKTLTCIVDLAHFTRVTNIGPVVLLQSIFGIIQTICDADLQGRYFVELAHISDNKNEAESYRTKALGYFQTANNMPGQAMAYHDLSLHYDAGSQRTRAGSPTDVESSAQ
ncbi:P-loop containing nucleoside triphosphate hydrolase protein [Mycena sp. CBHHK59/15]|nr:P-loop containing nucleoside triphosphate hydrolase protein [Mycena sp. CBHHK59/15]